ncbi:hypothetical protein RDI58_013248 [Solanum bulbocastanum]|uniref:Uncharacterized protein n=1 Tax=Solanum bulbocastanum TaxID=147425 RepID=A0AAN8TKL4_SOLBU
MAPGECVFRQTTLSTLIGKTTQDTQSVDDSNNLTHVVNTGILYRRWKLVKRCDINKANRTKLKSNHFMGSKAFVAARAEMGGTKPEGVAPDRIEFYKHTCYTSEKGWSSLEAETHYNNMLDLKDIYTSGESSMTIDKIVDIVPGTSQKGKT